MIETILKIEKAVFKRSEETYGNYDGCIITTDKQVIKTGVEDGQWCCENYGVMTSEDDLNDYMGSQLLSIHLVDTELNKKKWVDKFGNYDDEVSAMFINIETSNGTFQIVLYNEHNGYYGHEAYIESKQLNEIEGL